MPKSHEMSQMNHGMGDLFMPYGNNKAPEQPRCSVPLLFAS